jgi:fused signal recognition particle receptor
MIWAIVGAVALLVVIVAVALVRRSRGARRPPSAPDAVTVERPAGFGGGLARTRRALSDRIGSLLRSGPSEELWDGLEEALIAADVGVTTATRVVERVRSRQPADADEAREAIAAELIAVFGDRERALTLEGRPAVIVVVGVNGSGKTTTIAKLAHLLRSEGRSVMLGAADTFRAAASQQLQEWASRTGAEVVVGQDGADPASVAFDAFSSARARGRDAVIVDTAGRLHSKQNLMEELQKIVRVLEREAGKVDEVLLVLDGTSGQNGIVQARTFTEAVGVTAVAITKLDGTARGGIAVAVEEELGIPVKLVGVGETSDDLLHFDPVSFVEALLGEA